MVTSYMGHDIYPDEAGFVVVGDEGTWEDVFETLADAMRAISLDTAPDLCV